MGLSPAKDATPVKTHTREPPGQCRTPVAQRTPTEETQVSKNNHYSGDEGDIMALIGAVYGGDGLDPRESARDEAVAVLEAKNRRAYSSLRQFAETGKVAAPVDVRAEVTDLGATAQAAAPATAQAAQGAPVSEEKTETVKPPPPAEVISGVGAEFYDPGKTRTHIIRPKKTPKA
jgi:hypothetical protein